MVATRNKVGAINRKMDRTSICKGRVGLGYVMKRIACMMIYGDAC